MAALDLNFRTLYRRDLQVRLIDLALHLTAAVMLPGPWYLQWVPDVLVVPLWLHGMWTGRMLPEDSAVVRAHHVLHSWIVPALLLLTPVRAGYYVAALGLHWGAHYLIDIVTHDNWRDA